VGSCVSAAASDQRGLTNSFAASSASRLTRE
jgi:hypothetical protein